MIHVLLLLLLGAAEACYPFTPERCAIPKLAVPECPSVAKISTFHINTVPGNQLKKPKQNTRVEVCWSRTGLVVVSNATDDDVFNGCEACNCPVFEQGDVLEVFVGPVEHPTDNPEYYHEVDTGASGALWAAQTVHEMNASAPDGSNASNCGTADPSPCVGGELNCTGLADFGPLTAVVAVDPATKPRWWTNTLHIPWSLFKQPFLDPKVSPPWKVWRGNFYRYDYPFRTAGPGFNHSRHELTAWSPTHSGNFHTPARFGVIELV